MEKNMKIEDIYEIISGKLMELLENQPNEVTSCQNKLDIALKELQSTLSTNQLQQLENVMNIYTQLITLSDNFHFECGINIGAKIAKVFGI